MNTPAHAVVNLWILGRRERPELALPILAGSVLPDLPMYVFYLVVKVFERLPEREIWSHTYYLPGWQAAFDTFHSLPLILLGFGLAWLARSPRAKALFAGMALHVPEDLFLHHDDAHRHFYPFSRWRFASPVSYWDPRYHGRIVAPLEALAVVAGCVVLFRRYRTPGARIAVGAVGLAYLLFFGFALWMWA
jgi:hypothetical protein